MRGKTARSDEAQDRRMVARGVHEHEGNMHKGKPKTKLKLASGGKVHGGRAGHRLDRRSRGGVRRADGGDVPETRKLTPEPERRTLAPEPTVRRPSPEPTINRPREDTTEKRKPEGTPAYARGGRTKKHGTQVNIILKTGDKEKEQMAEQQGMAAGAKMAMAAPKPPMPPPPGAGAPPMPPPGAGGPPGMPPKPPGMMNRGGKITLKTGSGGGMARLQKNRSY